MTIDLDHLEQHVAALEQAAGPWKRIPVQDIERTHRGRLFYEALIVATSHESDWSELSISMHEIYASAAERFMAQVKPTPDDEALRKWLGINADKMKRLRQVFSNDARTMQWLDGAICASRDMQRFLDEQGSSHE